MKNSADQFFSDPNAIYTHYRHDIDGLRAVAVIFVVIYHVGLGTPQMNWLPGGLIGVDVFFVISGYLITRLIQRDTTKFSVFNFYERRVRRIAPALFFMILCTVPFAYFLLFPQPFSEFSGSARSNLLFVSNSFFPKKNLA